MKIKVLFILLVILAIWAFYTKSLYDGREEARNEAERLNRELTTAVKQSQLKAEAFAAREQSLINDRKELEIEYKKLLELRKTDKHFASWADDVLPDSVSVLLH